MMIKEREKREERVEKQEKINMSHNYINTVIGVRSSPGSYDCMDMIV